MYHYAQTYPQLFNQLLELDYSNSDLSLIRDAYELAMALFTSRFQPSGKVFMAHVVATASILASLRLPSSVVAAGLLHNAYRAGDFGDERYNVTIKKREEIRRLLGPEGEEYVARFATLNWAKLRRQNPDRLDAIDRKVTLILIADYLEHLLDLDVLYYEERERGRYLRDCRFAAETAQGLGLTSLAVELAEGIHQCETAQIPIGLPVERITNTAFVVAPASQRKRLAVRFKALAHRPQRLRQRVAAILQSIGRAGRRVARMKTTSVAFQSLFCEGARLERIASGFQFTEGPVWIAEERSLLFSDIPANRIVRLNPDCSVEDYRHPSGHSNGLTRDGQGRLIACEHGNRRVTRTEKDGSITVLADVFQGRKLNSPNDVIVKSDGAIYFTDPPYGIKPEEQEQAVQGVYRLSPDGQELTLMAGDLARPNGLAFSPDEKKLYIDDSQRRHIRVYEVREDGSLAGGSLFHGMDARTPGAPDGMKVDAEGRVYCSGAGGIWVFDKDGNHLGTIVTLEKPSNCAWGGADWRILYITAKSSVYAIRVRTPGIHLTYGS